MWAKKEHITLHFDIRPEKLGLSKSNTIEFDAVSARCQSNTIEFDAVSTRCLSNTIEFDAVSIRSLSHTIEFDAVSARFLSNTIEFDAVSTRFSVEHYLNCIISVISPMAKHVVLLASRGRSTKAI